MKISELFESSVTHIKKMYDVATGKEVMVNMDKAKPMSLLHAFAPTLGALSDMGLKTLEKPESWEQLEKPSQYKDGYTPWTELQLRAVEKKMGQKFERASGEELFGSKPRGPLASFKQPPDWKQAVVSFADGTKYFADSTQANSYIRMWALVK